MLFQIHRAKFLQLFFQHPRKKQGSHCCNNFLTVTLSYHSKVTHIGALHDEAGFPYESKIAFTASLLKVIFLHLL